MTIDDNVDFLNEAKICPSEGLDMIEIIQKYQKIDEIYKNWSYGADSCDCMKDIERVILDGNDD